MARALACIYVAMATLTGQAVAPAALNHMPTSWGYELSGACYWSPRPWTKALGPNTPVPQPDRAARKAEWACWHGRGLKTMIIFSAQIEAVWPSAATLAKWETDSAKQDPPRPDWSYVESDD